MKFCLLTRLLGATQVFAIAFSISIQAQEAPGGIEIRGQTGRTIPISITG